MTGNATIVSFVGRNLWKIQDQRFKPKAIHHQIPIVGFIRHALRILKICLNGESPNQANAADAKNRAAD